MDELTSETSVLLSEVVCADVPEGVSPIVPTRSRVQPEPDRATSPRPCACLPRLSRGRYVGLLVSSTIFLLLIGRASLLMRDAFASELYLRKWCYSQYSGAAHLLLFCHMPWVRCPRLRHTFYKLIVFSFFGDSRSRMFTLAVLAD